MEKRTKRELKLSKKDIENEKEIRKYKCGYCGYVFDYKVVKVDFEGISKRSHYSSQVRCFNCCNFLETWGGKE